MVSSTDSVVRVQNLAKTYRSGLLGRKQHKALLGVTLEIGPAQVFGLIGPNGAGKTTLVKVLLGLIRTFEGRAEMFGEAVGPAELRRRVGYLPEAHLLPPYLTGRQVLELFGQFSGVNRRELRQRIPAWLERVGIREAENRKVKEYSKGMKQRLGLAQALIHEPDLVFLDEPTDGVDPQGRKDIRDIVLEAKQKGATLFINSHLLAEVQELCDRVVILNKGRIQREGLTDDLAAATEAVAMTLEAPAEVVLDQLLGEFSARIAVEGQRYTLDIDDDQLQVAIDRLRARSVRILGLERRRLTLEDAFIETVNREGGQAQ